MTLCLQYQRQRRGKFKFVVSFRMCVQYMSTVLLHLCWEVSRAQTPQAFECCQQQCTALTDMCNWDGDLLLPWSGGVYELSVNSLPTANSVMHWRICTFVDVSAAILCTVRCNWVNTLILVGSLVIVTCLVNVKCCADFCTDGECILCVRDTACCTVPTVSCVGLLENCLS